MDVIFNKITLHNFGSYNHAEVELTNKGFCLVSGQNKCKTDNALSNGSGKSFLWSAICFALTGETIGGLKKNLKNIYNDDTDCYVTLDCKVDKDTYKITRIVAPASDLKIFKNDEDVSGKGITESKKKLEELLPDLTKDLIAATIILGQGMPNKFSSFTPAGRKELLEKLTKSDFMIDDIKVRLANRETEVSKQLREYEDILLVNNTKLQSAERDLEKQQYELDSFVSPDYDGEIKKANDNISICQNNINILNSNITVFEAGIEQANNELLTISSQKSAELSTQTLAYNESTKQISITKAQMQAEVSSLQKEITRLKSITDICPTCGQKLPGVERPSTEAQEQAVAEKQAAIKELDAQLATLSTDNFKKQVAIDEKYDNQLDSLKASLTDLKQNLSKAKSDLSTNNSYLSSEQMRLDKLIYDKEHIDAYYNGLKANINTLQKTINDLNNNTKLISGAKDDLVEHGSILKKMDTLVKRDFRSYLLENIIKYLNSRAKDYCEVVFETRDIEIYIDGNALDISYCGKMFDNLSGGEKQRIDLIIQFTIRDMLNTYLGYSSNILVLDEIFDNLDKVATDKILALISEKLKDIESIFIISHHADSLSISYDTEILVVKNENGISEVY